MSLGLFLCTVKWFHVLIYNSHNLGSVIRLHTFNSIWHVKRTLSGATIQGMNGPESDSNEGVLHIPPTYSDCLVAYLGYSFRGFLPLCRDAVGVFYSPSQLHLCKKIKHPSNESPGYDAIPSDGETSFLELWIMQSPNSWKFLQGPFWPKVAISVRALSRNCLIFYNSWNYLTVVFQILGIIQVFKRMSKVEYNY